MKAGWIGFIKENDNFWEMVEKYAKIGYKGMEGGEALLGKGNDAESVDRFYGNGLEVLTVSTSVEEARESVEPVIERAKLLRTNRATIWAGSIMYYNEPPSKKDFYDEIQTMETAAAALAKEKIKLCYHNHSQEFRICYDNVPAIDHMVLNAPNLWLEIDIAWTRFAGADPVAVLKRYAGRFAAVHLKDYIVKPTGYDADVVPVHTPVFTSLGTGVVDIIGVLEFLDECKMDWVIYEQDTQRTLNCEESMTLSYLYMKETGYIS